MKITKLFLVMLCSITVAACGGGSSGSGSGSGNVTSGTAAQYFTKKALNDTWTLAGYSGTSTSSMLPNVAEVWTITASSSNAITLSRQNTLNGVASGGVSLNTRQMDASGALVTSVPGGAPYILLPATFSAGTTWLASPANAASGYSGETDTIVALNVTRTMPVISATVTPQTFTDCLQINWTYSSVLGGVTTVYAGTDYISPSVGGVVSSSYTVTTGGVSTYAELLNLQPGYIAL